MNETPSNPGELLSARPTRAVSESALAAPLNELDDPGLLAILSQEHAGLLATRSLTWTESFSRAALFLSTLSAAVIVLGLVGPATQFGPQFFAFALVLLPVALFVGLATFLRIDEGNREDIFWVAGMNRIRQGYVRMRPAAAPFLILGTTDDAPGITRSYRPARWDVLIRPLLRDDPRDDRGHRWRPRRSDRRHGRRRSRVHPSRF